jgi:hypothetical protein
MAEKRLTGGCQCGAVRYSIPVPTSGVHYCHCRMCQKAVGNVFAALAPVPQGTVIWTRGKPTNFQSSTSAYRGFCEKCGTPLTFEYIGGKRINLTIGSLDDPGAVTPEVHYGTEAQVKWLCISDGLKHEATDEAELKKNYPGYQSFQHPDQDT